MKNLQLSLKTKWLIGIYIVYLQNEKCYIQNKFKGLW